MSRSPVEPGDCAARRALRRIASGVTVLTLDRGGQWHGVTVSAVLPISRSPLVIGTCLRTSSAFIAMVAEQPYFSINVLGDQQGPVAARFADPTRRPGDAQFAGLRWTVDQRTGAPLIGDCVAHLSCLVTDRLPIGDHELIIAEVIGGTAHAGIPLLTFAGRLQHDLGARALHRMPTARAARPRPDQSRATSQRSEPS